MADLETKTQDAFIARLGQHPALKGCNFKPHNSSTPKLNGDIIVRATRGSENPLHSGIFELAVTIELRVRLKNDNSSLPVFEKKVAAIAEVLETNWRRLAAELTASSTGWHCYDFTLEEKDDEPVDADHSCLWGCQVIAMPTSFKIADKLNNP